MTDPLTSAMYASLVALDRDHATLSAAAAWCREPPPNATVRDDFGDRVIMLPEPREVTDLRAFLLARTEA